MRDHPELDRIAREIAAAAEALRRAAVLAVEALRACRAFGRGERGGQALVDQGPPPSAPERRHAREYPKPPNVELLVSLTDAAVAPPAGPLVRAMSGLLLR